MPIRNSSNSNSLFSNSGTNGNSVLNSRRRGFNRRVVVQTPSLNYQLRRFEIVVNSRYDNLITKAIKLYIDPLGTGLYNLIPTSSSLYFNIVNPLIILSRNPEYEIIIKYILNAVKASRNIREMYDNKLKLENQILTLNQDIENFRLGINTKSEFGGQEATGKIGVTKTFFLTPLMSKYIETYGIPEGGIDSVKLYEIKELLILQGINPYN